LPSSPPITITVRENRNIKSGDHTQKAYFRLAQTPRVFLELDEWLRHRLRALQLKHWKRGKTMYRELLALGASESDTLRIARNSRRWWRNSRFLLNRAMPIAYFDRLGVPRLS